MRTVPKEQRRTANGVSLIMKEMDKKYLQSPANTSNSKFEMFNSMYRLKGETTESFILKYELAYDDLVKADPEVKCSERLLTLNALAHLEVDQKDKHYPSHEGVDYACHRGLCGEPLRQG